jgi:fructose-bisphosphate aldolase/2-amino-3,7-dideoxy-D-threo-hept-6-ulosonate synthase
MRGKELRLRRLFGKGKSAIVPMDHPVYFGPLPGIEDPVALVKDVASTDADGILLTIATMNKVVPVIGGLATIARLDGTHTRLGSHLIEIDRISSVEMAVAQGADACVLNIYVGADNERDLLRKLGNTAEECERWGLPLVGEMIPMAALAGHYGPTEKSLTEDELADQIALAARVGAEIGADVIKCNFTGSARTFKQVVKNATVPVIVAGGPGGDTVEGLLRLVGECMDAGAAGICFGRNVWKRPNRIEVVNAICSIVHCGTSVAEATKNVGA